MLQGQALFDKGVAFVGMLNPSRGLLEGQLIIGGLQFRGRFQDGKPHGEGEEKLDKDGKVTIFRGIFHEGERSIGVLM